MNQHIDSARPEETLRHLHIPSGFSSLQDKIDGMVYSYLESHPNFIKTVQQKDAALKGKTKEEVRAEIASYPGVIALAVHNTAHELYETGSALKKIQARELSEASRARTGIDIHPGTQIGDNLFIDHGTGVVVGETAKIGENNLIYHGVTLGAYGNPEESDPQKLKHRHPEIGNNNIISVGVNILGNVKIGNNVKIAPAAIITGNNLKIGDNVSIGLSAQIGDDNVIKDGVKIGFGAVIPRGMGEIKRDIPAYSYVGKNDSGELVIHERTHPATNVLEVNMATSGIGNDRSRIN